MGILKHTATGPEWKYHLDEETYNAEYYGFIMEVRLISSGESMSSGTARGWQYMITDPSNGWEEFNVGYKTSKGAKREATKALRRHQEKQS